MDGKLRKGTVQKKENLLDAFDMRNIRIEHNSTVTTISELNNKEAHVEFRFTAGYGSLGIIRLEGWLIIEGDAPELAERWAKKHQMPENIAQQVHNAIMRACIPETVIIARDMHLPPPIPMPSIPTKKSGKGKGSYKGVEFS